METLYLVLVIIEFLVIGFLVFKLIKNDMAYKEIVERSHQIVHGKLNVEDIKVNESKSTSNIIAGSVNAIKSNLMTFVEATKGNVIVLSDAIDVLSKSADANQIGNEQIANGVTVVAGKTSEQFELVKDNLELIEANSEQMSKVEEAMQSIRSLLDVTVTNCQEGIAQLEGYEKDMSAMSSELSNINQILTRFNEDIKRIGEVGDFIVSISNQLKLLALNASIEAARAGQSGRGFAVVADEMNDMSTKTKDGMDTINKILREIIASSEEVNESIRNCEVTYNKSVDTFEQVNSSFRSIDKQSNDIHNMMADVSHKFVVMANNTAETRNKATQLFDTSQAISENTCEIAAVSEEVAAESNEIASHTEKLGSMLKGIQGLLGQYNTAIVPSPAKRSKPVKIMLLSMYDNEFWYGVGRGANYAAKELEAVGSVAEFVPIIPTEDNDLETQVITAIKSAIQRGFDGLIFPGWMNTVGYGEMAIEKGLKVMVYNSDCPPEVARVACLCPDPAEPGLIAAQSLAKDLERSGNIGILLGNLEIASNVERYESFKKELKNYPGIKIIDEVSILDDDRDVYDRTRECLRNNKDLDALFITNGFPCAASRAIEDAGQVGKVQLYAFDTDPEIINYIKKGIIGCTVGQDSFGQGHDPIIWLYNYLAADEDFPSDIIHCRVSVVNKKNVDSLIV
ncbi:MAG: substrate-binding domain-containing protein [Lachnospiraceae bacterium]|nr:substrate-binding domain-containing protein [Lachnospiraceae bacterium]